MQSSRPTPIVGHSRNVAMERRYNPKREHSKGNEVVFWQLSGSQIFQGHNVHKVRRRAKILSAIKHLKLV